MTFTVLYLLWFAYFFYLPAHTVLEFSSVSLRLTRSVILIVLTLLGGRLVSFVEKAFR